MKNIKKLLSIVMVLAMVLSLGVSAFATAEKQDADVYLPYDYEDHDMWAYKIFDGDRGEPNTDRTEPTISTSGEAQLGITGWSDGVSVDELLTALAEKYPSAGFKTGMGAVDAAKAISDLKLSGQDAVEFSRIVAEHIDKDTVNKQHFVNRNAKLSGGYWIIVDETKFDEGTMPEDFAYSAYLLEVVGYGETLTLADKVDVPTVEKKVNSMDADVVGLGEVVTFTITATLPGDYAKYDHYYLEFVDSMDDGLTLNPNSFHITYDGETNPLPLHVEYSTNAETGDTEFSYAIDDLKRVAPGLEAGDTVVLTYTATVNENAVIREYNDAHIVYSNNPDSDGTPHGRTPDDTVIVFTFQLNGNKVDGNGDPLDGAGFTLFRADSKEEAEKGNYEKYRDELMVEKDADGKYVFDFKQLGEGFYRLEETTVPAGYNKADDIYFSVELTYDAEGNIIGAVIKNKDGEQDMLSADITFGQAENKYEGHIPETVINTDGLELPETGGIGTTIFYIVGAILVAGAVILLVTKRRVNGAEK